MRSASLVVLVSFFFLITVSSHKHHKEPSHINRQKTEHSHPEHHEHREHRDHHKHHDHDHDHSHDSHHHHHAPPHPVIAATSRALHSVLSPLFSLPIKPAAMTASLIVSSISLISLLLLPLTPHLHHLLPFAAGALLADLLSHLLPTLYASPHPPTNILLLSILSFALLDTILHRFAGHGHASAAVINLTADALHNFCDGLNIGAAFLVSFTSGISVTVATILHEIPQEIADYSLLLHAGYSKSKALAANFLCACTAMLGTYTAFYASEHIGTHVVNAVAGAGMIYLIFVVVITDVVKEWTKGPWSRIPIGIFMAWAGVAIVMLVEAAHEH